MHESEKCLQMSRRNNDPSAVPAHRESPRAAVLLLNVGTPASADTPAVRGYLREFLSDPRMVEIPRPLWWLILYGVILPFRAPRSAKAYRRIWSEHGSPLLVHSRALASGLRTCLGHTCPRVRVWLAMRYGRPDIEGALAGMVAENIQRLLVLPLYPQYSATTTASAFDQVAAALKRMRWLPELRFVTHYHREEVWQEAVAGSIRDFQAANGVADKLLFSFHGLPRRNLLLGDPYYCQCQASARRIAERLSLNPDQWTVAFQSRLGRAEWLKPYTTDVLRQLGNDGVDKVQVVCPGFAVDCLETLDEIAIENHHKFTAAGGGELQYIPALNAGEAHVRVVAELCRQHGGGWPEFEGVVADGGEAIRGRLERAEEKKWELGI